MPAPLDPEKREAIEQAIREGKTRNAIARDHGVSGATVTKLGKELEATGAGPAFDRSATKNATEARTVDLAARRAALAEGLMDDAEWLRKRLREEQVVGMTGSGEDRVPVTALPGGRDTQGFMVSIGIAIDKVNVLTSSDGGERGGTLLGSLVEEIRARRTTVSVDVSDDAAE